MHPVYRLALTCLALALSLPAPAAAAPRNSSAGSPAFVDLKRVLEEYQKTSAFQKYGQRVQTRMASLNQEMETLAQLRYATEAERKEGLALKGKANPTDREKARFQQLVKKSDDLDNELAQLGQKKDPTQADTQRIQELSQKRAEAARSLAKEEADRRDQVRQLASELREEVENELLRLVEKVAKDRNLPFIYERRAVLFGGSDYTDEVIKKLPK